IELCAIPCASVSAKRTPTSVVNGKPSTAGTLRSPGERRARRRRPARAATLRRPDRGRRVDGERYPRVPVADGALGAFRPVRVRLDRGLPLRPGEGLAVLRTALRRPDRGGAERRAPCARPARVGGARPRGGHAEHRPPARAGRQPRGRRGARLDPQLDLPRVRRSVSARARARAPRGGRRRRAGLPGLRPDPEARRRLLRRAPSRGAVDRAFALAREAALLLVVGSALEVYPVASLPLETLDAGGELVIVNHGPTAFD